MGIRRRARMPPSPITWGSLPRHVEPQPKPPIASTKGTQSSEREPTLASPDWREKLSVLLEGLIKR
jgi:hypothetical protein